MYSHGTALGINLYQIHSWLPSRTAAILSGFLKLDHTNCSRATHCYFSG